jgi:hypothetical protein
MPIGGGPAVTIAPEQAYPFALAQSPEDISWSTGLGQIRKLAK